MWSLSHCTINELLESFYFNFAIKIISYDFHRIVISFILSFIVTITCVIFRLGCSLKTEFMRAILAALRRASAFVGQVCDIDIDIVIIVNLLGKSVILILILWSLSIRRASLWYWNWYCDHCQLCFRRAILVGIVIIKSVSDQCGEGNGKSGRYCYCYCNCFCYWYWQVWLVFWSIS